MIEEAKRLAHIREYYFSAKLREVAGMIADGKPILNLGIGNPDMPPSEATISQLQDSASRSDFHGYQPYKGIPALRQAMSAWYDRTYGVQVDPETEILPLIGSKEGIHHICEAFLDPGDLALVPDPGYPSYNSAIRLAGAEPVNYHLDERNNWEPVWDELKAAVLSKVKLWFVNYPNMPTGASGSREMMDRIVELARRFDILVVNDNPYSLVLPSGPPMSILQSDDSLSTAMELNSLSKSHNMAGWRIGMLLGRQEYIQSVLKVKSNIDSGMFRPLQEAAIAALDNSEEWHQARNAAYKERRKLAEHIMDAIGCIYDPAQVGMFLWARIPDGYPSVETLTEKLLHEAHVFITPGFIFGENGKRYVRISLCSRPEQLNEALHRINKLEL